MKEYNVFNNRGRRVYSNYDNGRLNNLNFDRENYFYYNEDFDTEFSSEIRFSNSFIQNKDKALIEKEETKKRIDDSHNFLR